MCHKEGQGISDRCCPLLLPVESGRNKYKQISSMINVSHNLMPPGIACLDGKYNT